MQAACTNSHYEIDGATYPVVVSPSGDFSGPDGPTTDCISVKGKMRIAGQIAGNPNDLHSTSPDLICLHSKVVFFIFTLSITICQRNLLRFTGSGFPAAAGFKVRGRDRTRVLSVFKSRQVRNTDDPRAVSFIWEMIHPGVSHVNTPKKSNRGTR